LLIENILKNALHVTAGVKTFVLQPMTAQSLLRKWLIDNGYAIVNESLVRERNRFYEVIVAEHGVQRISKEVYYDIGCMLIKKRDPLLKEFIEHKIAKTEVIITQLEAQMMEYQGTSNTNKTLEQFKRKLQNYREVYEWIIRCSRL
jgi:tRNA (adenine22-N1)-methyltransferase